MSPLPPCSSAANSELLSPQPAGVDVDSGGGGGGDSVGGQRPLLKVMHGNVLGGESVCTTTNTGLV